MTTQSMKTRCLFLAAVAAALLGSPTRARADHIDERLLAEAPKVMKYLRDHHYTTVGVVKFTVKKGDAAPTLNAGPLNTKMALRLENALVLLNDPKQPINVLTDVGKTAAAASRSATAKTGSGRRGLLEHNYPLAWGSDKKQPDALLTGEVRFGKDMKKATVVIQAFDRKKPEQLHEVVTLADVPTDRNMLASIGQSFVVSSRKLKRGARDADEAAVDDAANRDKVSPTAAPNAQPDNPLASPDEPVKLEIYYDGQPVPIEPDSSSPGELRVRKTKAADPKEGQKVKFVIKNTGQETVGVVLAVNGKSTLFQEDLTSKSPGECTKWVLGPGDNYTIEGFYLKEDGSEIKPFRVLSDEESAKVELSPEHKGVFSMFVFREGAGKLSIAGPETTDLSRRPRGRGKTAQDARAGAEKATHTRSAGDRLVADKTPPKPAKPVARQQKGGRGLLVEDEKAVSGSALNRVEAKFDPQPASSIFIRYYQSPAN